MMTYYVRELCQKQHHLRSWRKRHSFDLRNAKHGGGIRVYATPGEAKREGISRPQASLRGIRRRDDLVYKRVKEFGFHRQFIF